MLVRVSVNVVAMTMKVRMSCSRHSAGGGERAGNPLEYAGQVRDAQENQHQADRKLHRETDARGNHPAEKNNSATNDENGQRVAEPPKRTDQCRMADLLVSRHNGRDGDHVIGIRGMPHAEEEAEHDDRK
jgi:hypothetical protein